MRHFEISNSSFKSPKQDLINIETFRSMIGQEMEEKSQNFERSHPRL